MTFLSVDEKWNAVVTCDKAYDGAFYYAVRTTGIYCRPSCGAKTPLRENVQFFNHRDEAVAASFRPCKKCRPDLLVYEPERELVERAKQLMASNVGTLLTIRDIMKQLGISQSSFNSLFQKYVHASPKQYWTRLKIEQSARLLTETETSIVQAALSCGFMSLSSYYKCFKEQTGTTPSEYRKQGRC
ncbi:bifunctional transcriptional activator/DNA repair enzyme AdaA [Paenibacillus marinisediminis]